MLALWGLNRSIKLMCALCCEKSLWKSNFCSFTVFLSTKKLYRIKRNLTLNCENSCAFGSFQGHAPWGNSISVVHLVLGQKWHESGMIFIFKKKKLAWSKNVPVSSVCGVTDLLSWPTNWLSGGPVVLSGSPLTTLSWSTASLITFCSSIKSLSHLRQKTGGFHVAFSKWE